MIPIRSTTTEKGERKRKVGTRKPAAFALPLDEPDAVAQYMEKTRGTLGAGYRLDC
ncbi:hypothetical protein U8326_14110 [Tsuneonella sp. CC-YZS046]|uniref:hypothetical protein n=1 Tax=Tsuneonella sp. CC-YZS046 TaxID=3042152 RepID=UPI0026D56F7E|nr:hypothetical protein [Tsuneonella sp. CC-YZS046]WRO66162.1 hypothetical protein U8326_14110 [Tsuneonella sp. CC-YZS046]